MSTLAVSRRVVSRDRLREASAVLEAATECATRARTAWEDQVRVFGPGPETNRLERLTAVQWDQVTAARNAWERAWADWASHG